MNFKTSKTVISQLVIIGICAFVMLLGLIASIVSSYVSDAEREDFMKTALVCEGTVTDCYKTTLRSVIVKYDMDMDYVIDGETYHAKNIEVETDYSVGDNVTVYYAPDNPTRFIIDEGEEKQEYKMYRTGRTIAITLFVLLFLFILWFYHKESAQY